MDALDNATAMNLENLEKVGQNLLKQPVYSMNVTTFQPEEEKEWGTNAKALKRCVNYILLFVIWNKIVYMDESLAIVYGIFQFTQVNKKC